MVNVEVTGLDQDWEQHTFTIKCKLKPKNFCPECGAKLRDYQKAELGRRIDAIRRRLLDEKPKPEPVGNFAIDDAVYVDDDPCSMAVLTVSSSMLKPGYLFGLGRDGERHHVGVHPRNLRHVHKCDDGRKCNCKTCNPCGKADDLDCTCEKCCPRTLDGLVELFGKDVVVRRIAGMAEWSTTHNIAWMERIAYSGIQFQRCTRLCSHAAPYGDIHETRRKINPDFYKSTAWQSICETACVFDGTKWTPKKGSE